MLEFDLGPEGGAQDDLLLVNVKGLEPVAGRGEGFGEVGRELG